MTSTLRPTLTPARRAWLERLEREGLVYARGQDVELRAVAAQCWHLNWTKTAWNDTVYLGDRLTLSGIAVLAEARGRERG